MTENNGLWPQHTFTYGPVTATVERQTVRHSILFSRILGLLPAVEDKAEEIHRDQFARIVTQTVQVDGLDLAWPALNAPPKDWARAYEAFLRMDGGLMNAWYQALEEVDRPPTAREFWPSHQLTEDERKNRPSAGSSGKTPSGAASPSSSPSAVAAKKNPTTGD